MYSIRNSSHPWAYDILKMIYAYNKQVHLGCPTFTAIANVAITSLRRESLLVNFRVMPSMLFRYYSNQKHPQPRSSSSTKISTIQHRKHRRNQYFEYAFYSAAWVLYLIIDSICNSIRDRRQNQKEKWNSASKMCSLGKHTYLLLFSQVKLLVWRQISFSIKFGGIYQRASVGERLCSCRKSYFTPVFHAHFLHRIPDMFIYVYRLN